MRKNDGILRRLKNTGFETGTINLSRSIHEYTLSRKKNGKAQGFPVKRPSRVKIGTMRDTPEKFF
jgi:hypothetical protein